VTDAGFGGAGPGGAASGGVGPGVPGLDGADGAHGSGGLDGAGRREELASRLHLVRKRIAAACAAAGRNAGETTLIAITKTRPASDVRLLYELGLGDFGENRDQEAAPKAEQCAGLPITWHFVGQLQTNKAASVARYADVVHSVDRLRLVRALGAAARRHERVLTCLIQVSLDEPAGLADGESGRPGAPGGSGGPGGPAGRGGAPPGEVAALAGAVAGEDGLVLGGVMAVAPMGVPAADAFAGLAPASAAVRAVRPEATIISAGMSADLEAAVAAGATHLRIGTALLGSRPPRAG
jgi:PLP dependent protein